MLARQMLPTPEGRSSMHTTSPDQRLRAQFLDVAQFHALARATLRQAAEAVRRSEQQIESYQVLVTRTADAVARSRSVLGHR